MKNILIIGCGLLGSSLVRRILKKKITKKIFVYEKSKKNILKIKRINSKISILEKLGKFSENDSIHLKEIVWIGVVPKCLPMPPCLWKVMQSESQDKMLKEEPFHIVTQWSSLRMTRNKLKRLTY